MTWMLYADTWYLLFITWICPVSAPLCQFNWLFYMFPDHSKCNKIWFEDASASGGIISHKLRNTPGSGCSPVAADHHHLLLLLPGPGPGLLAAVACEEAGGEDHAPHLQETRLHRAGSVDSDSSITAHHTADQGHQLQILTENLGYPVNVTRYHWHVTRDKVHVTRDTRPLHLRLQPV